LIHLPPLSRVTLLTGVGAVVVMTMYLILYWESNPPASLLSRQSDPDRIDLYAEQIRGVKYDATGRPVQTLWAAKMDHYPARGQSVLQTPVLLSLGKDSEVWNTTAASGILIGDAEIQLHDQVVIVDSKKTVKFETEALSYFPDRQEATSDVAVTLNRLGDTTTAVGMRADLARNRIELLKRVTSIHVQP
jgi:lipopolysaccharide export system protein LptC